VKLPEQDESVDNLLSLTSGDGNELESLLSSGKKQEAKQLIVAVASLINTTPMTVYSLNPHNGQ